MTLGQRLILPLAEVGRDDLEVAGGKGANLGELVRAGFPVPPGFIVSTAAYADFVRANSLGRKIAGAAKGSAPDSIRAAFEAGSIPVEIEAAIRNAYAD